MPSLVTSPPRELQHLDMDAENKTSGKDRGVTLKSRLQGRSANTEREVTFSRVTGGQKAFWYFLKSEFCEENLDFWLACQEFQTCDSPEELTRRAASIYEEFIGDESPRQVNIDFYTREIISQSLQQPSPSCFVVAQKKIYSLMENGSFPRFIQSENYKVLFDGAVKQRRQTRSRHFPFPQNVTSTT
ncbi:hypothetical protein F2P81_000853 [Scophthalmus maximus]|uniref:RGS domain-containing protein n=1 Tax=Scophthalmus maximus TaxID=52904 RepID=A0A6A4TU94_SCOMX|nr:hypothetical protein F2P81_000853 [Scophthalmus maximus]